MNIAIIIGIKTYTNLTELPACKNDAAAIHEIIKRSEKYNHILYLNDETDSVKLKNSLSNFIAQIKSQAVDEIFFYYSGHGEFYDEQFYYLLTDYDYRKRNQTALQNAEVDQLFRTLSPNLTVKIIDSCQSGTNYIKASGALDAYFKKSAQDKFKNCYFIYSSLNTQSSYASHEISAFTSSLISAIKNHDGDDLRYKYIIDVISDDFIANNNQKPFFVTQASFTERFLTINKQLRDYLNGEIDYENPTLKSDTYSHPSIADLIKLDAKNYTNKEGALKVYQMVQNLVTDFSLKPELKEFYQISSKFLQAMSASPSKYQVAKWLDEHPGEYFAVPIYEESYDEEVGVYTYFKEFSFNIEIPFKEVSLDVIGIYPNVPSFNCSVLTFVSKKSVRFFYSITPYKDIDFDEIELVKNKIEWITTEVIITRTEEIRQKIEDIKGKIENLIETDLQTRFYPTGSEQTQQ